MKSRSQARPAKADEDRLDAAGLSLKRKLVSALAAAFLTALAFVFLFTGYLEGGAFVSMLTLAFGTGLVLLVWNRIEQFTLFGSEIKLRRLAHQAEDMLSGLDESRVDVYRTMLRLTDGALETQSPAVKIPAETFRVDAIQNKPTQALVGLLQSIERAELIDRLADDIADVADKAIERTTNSLKQRDEHFRQALDDARIENSPGEIAGFYTRWARGGIGNGEADSSRAHGLMAGPVDRSVALTQLEELLRYREMAKALRKSPPESS
ncbi:hypothetical protein [Pistricoccus aurantiacus]|uniref:hypothetical protein n=1 Tax=Pistricoccus aurantiacus TaxID=1883414 RepID=UPI003624E089